MIEMRAVRVLDHLEVVVKCVHSVASGEGHTLAHVTAELHGTGPGEMATVLGDLYAGMAAASDRGSITWTDECGWV